MEKHIEEIKKVIAGDLDVYDGYYLKTLFHIARYDNKSIRKGDTVIYMETASAGEKPGFSSRAFRYPQGAPRGHHALWQIVHEILDACKNNVDCDGYDTRIYTEGKNVRVS